MFLAAIHLPRLAAYVCHTLAFAASLDDIHLNRVQHLYYLASCTSRLGRETSPCNTLSLCRILHLSPYEALATAVEPYMFSLRQDGKKDSRTVSRLRELSWMIQYNNG